MRVAIWLTILLFISYCNLLAWHGVSFTHRVLKI